MTIDDRYRCPVCRHWYDRGETDVRCLVLHGPGECCHHGETPVPDTYDDIPDRWRAAADDLIDRGESIRARVRDVLSDTAKLRDDAEALWDVGNWARSYYVTNDQRVSAEECLSMVLDLHASNDAGFPVCTECRNTWPCETVRLVRPEATA